MSPNSQNPQESGEAPSAMPQDIARAGTPTEDWQRLAEVLRFDGERPENDPPGSELSKAHDGNEGGRRPRNPPGLLRVYPDPGGTIASNLPKSASFLEGLGLDSVAANAEHHESGEQLQESVNGLLHQLSVFESISRCPILAITGILNSGKSSLLASYLSPENRGRVLRGLGNQAGTHRFVLWLPKVWWDDAELLNTLISFLSSLFGHPPEHLADDPETAALQYNGSNRSQCLDGTQGRIR